MEQLLGLYKIDSQIDCMFLHHKQSIAMSSSNITQNVSTVALYQPILVGTKYQDYCVNKKEFEENGGVMKCGLCCTNHTYKSHNLINIHKRSKNHKKKLEAKNPTPPLPTPTQLLPPSPPPPVNLSVDNNAIIKSQEEEIAAHIKQIQTLYDFIIGQNQYILSLSKLHEQRNLRYDSES